jgi:general secretion pathway protein A
VFPYALTRTLYQLTGGVPRLINLVCDRALLGAYVQGKTQVTSKILYRAAREVFGVSLIWRRWRRFAWPVAVCGALGVAGVAAGNVSITQWPISWPRAPTSAATLNLQVPANVQADTARALQPVTASAEPVAAEPAHEPRLENLRWPDELAPRAQSEGLAFQELFRLYGVAYEPRSRDSACKAAETVDMHCFVGRGGLSDLQRLNQPAVLLMDGAGKAQQFHAVLAALDDQSASFIVAGQIQRVSLSSIAPLWSGSYALLWKSPPGAKNGISDEARGPAVLWLRQSLARVQGGDADGPASFDKNLAHRVKTFQLAEGIAPDGVAGALTLMRLNMRLDERLPRLTAARRGG